METLIDPLIKIGAILALIVVMVLQLVTVKIKLKKLQDDYEKEMLNIMVVKETQRIIAKNETRDN